MAFTDSKIRSLKPKEDRYIVWEDGKTTMGVRVGAKTKTFLYKYWNGEGKQRWMTIGKFPATSLADARMKVAESRKKLDKGIDPADAHLQAKTAEREAETVTQLMEEYLEKYAKARKSPRCAKEDERILKKDVIPAWGNRKASSIARREVILLLDSIVKRKAPVQANRTFACISKMFNFAVRRDIVPASPCVGIEKPSKENKRDRVLNETEIKAFWENLDKAIMNEGIKLALKFQLLTGQRKGEVAMAEWSECDLPGRMWVIPAEKSKNRIPHRVPLSPQAMDIIREIKALSGNSKWLFPTTYFKSKDVPITSGAIDHAVNKNKNVIKISDFSPHDLRRSAATFMTGMGVQRIVVSRILNHSEGGITSVYDRHSYDKEKRQAIEQWGRKLDDIVTGKKAGKVIALKRK